MYEVVEVVINYCLLVFVCWSVKERGAQKKRECIERTTWSVNKLESEGKSISQESLWNNLCEGSKVSCAKVHVEQPQDQDKIALFTRSLRLTFKD